MTKVILKKTAAQQLSFGLGYFLKITLD